MSLCSTGDEAVSECVTLPRRDLMRGIEVLMGCRDRALLWFGGALPSFHAFGFIWQLILPLTCGLPMGHFPPSFPSAPIVPNPENTLQASRMMRCNGLPAVPAFVEVRILSMILPGC